MSDDYRGKNPPLYDRDRMSITMITEHKDGTTTGMTVEVNRENLLVAEVAVLNAFRRLCKLHGFVETHIDEESGE